MTEWNIQSRAHGCESCNKPFVDQETYHTLLFDERADFRRVFVYEQPHTGDIFTIVDPNLQLNQLEAVQRDVASLLEYGLNPPPEAIAGTAMAGEPAANSISEAGSIPVEAAEPAA